MSVEEVKERIYGRSLSSPMLTDVDLSELINRSTLFGEKDADILRSRGMTFDGDGSYTVCLLYPDLSVGSWKVTVRGQNTLLVIGEPPSVSNVSIQVRLGGKDCTLLFPDLRASSIWLADVSLRGDEQTLFWGAHASAVHTQIEIEGKGSRVLVGDDCMFSSGIWIRNYDMHAIFDTSNSEIINKVCSEMLVEQHVWVGQDTLLLAVDCIGFGSIVGAKSLVSTSLEPESLAVGSPARVIRQGVSWSRLTDKVEPHVVHKLQKLRSLQR